MKPHSKLSRANTRLETDLRPARFARWPRLFSLGVGVFILILGINDCNVELMKKTM